MTNHLFIRANEMLLGVTKLKKEQGLGAIESKPPINEADMEKTYEYFQKNKRGEPNPANLQEMCIFYII